MLYAWPEAETSSSSWPALRLSRKAQVCVNSATVRHAKRHPIYMQNYYHLSVFGSESIPNFCAMDDNIRLSITTFFRGENFPATS